MEYQTIDIEIYDKRVMCTYTLHVLQLSNTSFKMLDNDIVNPTLTFGTEFETKLNKDSKYQVVKILKKSNYTIKKFYLNSQFSQSEYRMLGDEIIKAGGFWQVDFGSMAIINLPENSDLNIDEIFRTFNFNPIKIKD